MLWNQKGADSGSILFAGTARSYRSAVGGRHAGDLMLWNQKGADSGFILFAGTARSYNAATS